MVLGPRSSERKKERRRKLERAKIFKMFINDKHGQIIIRNKSQLAFHSRSLRVENSRSGTGRGSITAGRRVETGIAARPGGLGAARSHHGR
jgi:hypothetical protein